MTITYEIFEAEGLIKELWLGDISIADVRQHWQSLLTDKRALTHRKGLSDLRKATFKFSNDDLALAVLEVAEPMLEGETWVSAIVVLTPEQFRLSSAYQGLAIGYSHDVLFSDVIEAMRWLIRQ